MRIITEQRRKRKKRSSSDILDEFIDDSLRSASGSKKRRRRSSSSSKKQRSLPRLNEEIIEPVSKPARKKSHSNERPRNKKRSRSEKMIEQEAVFHDLVEDPADELLKRDRSYRQSKGKVVTDLVIGVLITCVFIAMLFFYVKFDRAEVISGSMEPTLMTNEKVVIMNGRSPKQFNLVVFYPPTKSNDKYVKRVIGLPGDEVAYKDDILYINGEMYEEPYLKANKQKFAKEHPNEVYTQDLTMENIPGVEKGTTVIPADMYFVLGDNRQNSQDSRFIGLIPKDNLVGTVWKKDPLPQKIKP